jgi:hypothetical protein
MLNELKKCIQQEIGPIDDTMGYIEPGNFSKRQAIAKSVNEVEDTSKS